MRTAESFLEKELQDMSEEELRDLIMGIRESRITLKPQSKGGKAKTRARQNKTTRIVKMAAGLSQEEAANLLAMLEDTL